MNYRHAYHAGNFADVVKHILLVRVIEYLKRKDTPFFLLDTHAGIGRYDLTGTEAQKTLEYERGLLRFLAGTIDAPEKVCSLIEPYRNIVQSLNIDGDMTTYPGSPLIAAQSVRSQDRLSFNELHPDDVQALASEFKRTKNAKTHNLDAWVALKAQLPPHEKRGLILIDPPFEKRDEFDALVDGLKAARKRFATGTFMLWYPIKDLAAVKRFRDGIKAVLDSQTLDAHLLIDEPSDDMRLIGTGMAVINPPYVLRQELETLLPWLCQIFETRPESGSWVVDNLVGES